MFSSVDPDGLIRDLITLKKRDGSNNEDTRYVYFDIFLTLLQIIPKTLIFIEDFEKIDSSSYDVLKYLLEAFEQLENIIEQLSAEEVSLSDSMNLYKKGVKLLDKCSQTLDKTQKEIIILQEGQNDIHKGTASEENRAD